RKKAPPRRLRKSRSRRGGLGGRCSADYLPKRNIPHRVTASEKIFGPPWETLICTLRHWWAKCLTGLPRARRATTVRKTITPTARKMGRLFRPELHCLGARSMSDTSLTRRSFLTGAAGAAVVASATPLRLEGAEKEADFCSRWEVVPDRVWPGPEFWTNPLQDWRVAQGRLECVKAAPGRNVHVLTRAAS